MWWRKKTAFTRFIWVDLRSCHTTHYPSRDRHIVICWLTFWFLNLSWPDPNFSTVSLIWNKVSLISVIFLESSVILLNKVLSISDIDPICSLIYFTSFFRVLNLFRVHHLELLFIPLTMEGNKSGNRIRIRKNITIQWVESIEFQQLLQNCIPTVFRADANVDKKLIW